MSHPEVRFVSETGTSRLLSAAYVTEPAIAPLHDDDAERAVLEALEARTSARLVAQSGRAQAERLPFALKTEAFGFGWTYVNAAFAYTRRGGNRFNDEGQGAWYAALAVETALAEVSFHLERELRNTGETENVTKYVQLLGHIEGPMAVLEAGDGSARLDPDPAVGYPAGQGFARETLARNIGGISYPSVRDIGGTCFAVLMPAYVKAVTRGADFVLTWDGVGMAVW